MSCGLRRLAIVTRRGRQREHPGNLANQHATTIVQARERRDPFTEQGRSALLLGARLHVAAGLVIFREYNCEEQTGSGLDPSLVPEPTE